MILFGSMLMNKGVIHCVIQILGLQLELEDIIYAGTALSIVTCKFDSHEL